MPSAPTAQDAFVPSSIGVGASPYNNSSNGHSGNGASPHAPHSSSATTPPLQTDQGITNDRSVSVSAKALVITGTALAVVVIGVVSVLAFMQWQRAQTAEVSLASANQQIATQTRVIDDLNDQIAKLNDDLDTASSDLSKSQDEAAVNEQLAKAYEAAAYEFNLAAELLQGAIGDIANAIGALGSGSYYSAEGYVDDAVSKMEQAKVHKANGLAALP